MRWLAISDEFLGKLHRDENILNLEKRDMEWTFAEKTRKPEPKRSPDIYIYFILRGKRWEKACPGPLEACP